MNEFEICPSQYGLVEIRLQSPSESDTQFSKVYLSLEAACFKWYEDRHRFLCRGIAYVMNKVEVLKDDVASKDDKRKIIRCQVAIKSGSAILDIRVSHGSKIWQLAIDTHFSRCVKPLAQLPSFAFDLDDARYSTLHLSTTAKISLGAGTFEIPVSILDDVEEKVNILFPLNRHTSPETRRDITAAVMKAQNQLVLEVLRRHQHLEAADHQVQRTLTKMTERALTAEQHADSLHAIMVQIEEVLPQFSHQLQLLQQHPPKESSPETPTNLRGDSGAETIEHNVHRSGSSTPTGLGTISWRKKVEILEEELHKKSELIDRLQRDIYEQQHQPVFQSKIQQLQQENHSLREVTATLRGEIVGLSEQLQDIQQLALAQIETLHETNPEIAAEAAASLRHNINANSQINEEGSIEDHHDFDSNQPISVDLSAFLTGKVSASPLASSSARRATATASSPSIFRRPLDLDALQVTDEERDLSPRRFPRQDPYQLHEEEKASYFPPSGINRSTSGYSQEQTEQEESDRVIMARLTASTTGSTRARSDIPLLENQNWTNKYQDYVQQLTSSASSPSSSPSMLQEHITSIGWTLVEEKLLTQLYWHYVHVGHVPGASFSQTHGMSLTKFQKFLKDFHVLAIHPTTPLSSTEQARSHHPANTGSSSSNHVFTAAYVSGQPLHASSTGPSLSSSSAATILDKQLTHSDVSAIFTVASSTKIIASSSSSETGGGHGAEEGQFKESLTNLWTQIANQFASNQSSSSSSAAGGGSASSVSSSSAMVGSGHPTASSGASASASAPPKAAFKVHGGHRSAAEALDFYHTQHVLFNHREDAGNNGNQQHSSDAMAAAAFAVGHPGGVGVAVGVVNPASALLSLPQFRYALTLVAEKLYARVLQQAMGIPPSILTGKDRIQAVRAMFELLWVKNLSPIALSLDLVPHALSALRVFLVHVHSDTKELADALSVSINKKSPPKLDWSRYLSHVHRFFYEPSSSSSASSSHSFGMLRVLCDMSHLQLLSSLFRSYCSASTQSSSGKKGGKTATSSSSSSSSTSSLVVEPLGMAQETRDLSGLTYLLHPHNHLPRLAMSFGQFRRCCLAQGLLPYLIGEHQLYALYQEVVVMVQLYSSIFPLQSIVESNNGSQASSFSTNEKKPSNKSSGKKSKSALSSAQQTQLQLHWSRQRCFPAVHLPALAIYYLAEADKRVVHAERLQETIRTPWDTVFQPATRSSLSIPAEQSQHQRPVDCPSNNMVGQGIDLMGFVILCGTLAMKAFPHIPPPARFAQLLALLHQNNPHIREQAQLGDAAESFMVGDGYNFGGVFLHNT